MVEFLNATLERVSVHQIGNKNSGEEIRLSKSFLDISDSRLRELLLKFFVTPFGSNEFYSFTFTNGDFSLNPIYIYATKIFENFKAFHANSVDIAKHLYEVSNHPQIKSGELFVAYFTGITLFDETTDAIGIFKSENKQFYLKLQDAQDLNSLFFEDGINIEKLDKGCFIFNTDGKNGYKICMVDKSNKSTDAQFWKDSFLMLHPCKDDFNKTKEILNITKNYVTRRFSEEFEVSKAEQIDLLNRSLDYFKTHDAYDKNEFEKEVFHHPEMITSFRNFDAITRKSNSVAPEDNFDISPAAVKKQARIFKSVLKLDKNFHIYIHGKKELIEQGVESDGRKYYKIYYNEEY